MPNFRGDGAVAAPLAVPAKLCLVVSNCGLPGCPNHPVENVSRFVEMAPLPEGRAAAAGFFR
jgi:hypothetical protein